MKVLTVAVVLTSALLGVAPQRMDTLGVSNNEQVSQHYYTLPPVRVEERVPTVRANILPVKVVRGDLDDFLDAIADFESDGRVSAVSRNGHLGKYQFHPRTIHELGFDVSRRRFLHDEDLQDRVMLRYMHENESELHDIIKKFVGKTIRGVKITRSGILAGAHFAGTYGLRTWFYPRKYSGITRDRNGASVALYLKKFGNYDIER